jgi:UDP:flavonoid glycosyltransferase YjiC (YdhE family)
MHADPKNLAAFGPGDARRLVALMPSKQKWMRIGIQIWGSRGDIRPLLALAEGLQLSGHEVSLLITCIESADYNASLSNAGVKIQNVASPVIRDKDDKLVKSRNRCHCERSEAISVNVSN